MLAVTSFELMRRSQGCKNPTLTVYLMCILLTSIGAGLAYTMLWQENFFLYFTSLIVSNTFSFFGHWVIAQTYIRVAFETTQLLDPEVYLNDRSKIQKVDRFNLIMKIANGTVLILTIVLNVLFYIAALHGYVFMYFFSAYSQTVLLWVFLLAWGITLWKLYRSVNHSAKLLPNKKVFISHAAILGIFLTIYSL